MRRLAADDARCPAVAANPTLITFFRRGLLGIMDRQWQRLPEAAAWWRYQLISVACADHEGHGHRGGGDSGASREDNAEARARLSSGTKQSPRREDLALRLTIGVAHMDTTTLPRESCYDSVLIRVLCTLSLMTHI